MMQGYEFSIFEIIWGRHKYYCYRKIMIVSMCPLQKELAGTAVPFSEECTVLFQRNTVVETPLKDHRVSKINSNLINRK